jgi:glutathione S-transferase
MNPPPGMPDALPRLYQTEWCPASHRVRQRLTELGVAFVAVPVPVEREERTALLVATGEQSIPVLVAADGTIHVGEGEILAALDDIYDEPAGALAHRLKAERVRRRQLEEAAA